MKGYFAQGSREELCAAGAIALAYMGLVILIRRRGVPVLAKLLAPILKKDCDHEKTTDLIVKGVLFIAMSISGYRLLESEDLYTSLGGTWNDAHWYKEAIPLLREDGSLQDANTMQRATGGHLFYLAIGLGYHSHSLIYDTFIVPGKATMMIHHIATIILITGAYTMSIHRHGCGTLLIHDISDVCLYLMRSMRKLDKRFHRLVPVSAVGFMAAIVYCRLYSYPMEVIYPWAIGTLEASGVLPLNVLADQMTAANRTEALARFGISVPKLYVLLSCLLALLALHIYWVFLLVQGLLFHVGCLKTDAFDYIKASKASKTTKTERVEAVLKELGSATAG